MEQVEVLEQNESGMFSIRYEERYTIRCFTSSKEDQLVNWSKLTMSHPLFEKLSSAIYSGKSNDPDQLLNENGFAGLPPELMDRKGIDNATNDLWSELITSKDIRGILHNHSTWSDGIHSLEEMALYVRDQGYEYFAITDHSRSAFYANGLLPERVHSLWICIQFHHDSISSTGINYFAKIYRISRSG